MHAKSNDEAAMLRTKEKISLTETRPSNVMKIVTEDRIEAMRGKKGKAFDKAFIQAQVELHQKTLEKLELSMIPNAQNPQLKAMLEKTKGEVKHHLEMAQKLETSVQ
jgi:putative membrane protein